MGLNTDARNDRKKEDYQYHKKLGLCVNHCGKEVARKNGALCEDCRQRQRNYMTEIYSQAISAGLCGSCKRNDPRPGKTTCQSCHDRAAGYHRKLYARRVEAGLCAKCGKEPLKPGMASLGENCYSKKGK
jgi:predicted CXXCH cytochrome family protein